MKVSMIGGVVVLSPECADDHAAMHQMASEGIASMRLMDDDQEAPCGPGLRGPLVIQTGGGRKPVAPASAAPAAKAGSAAVPVGLMYRRKDGVEISCAGGEQWLVTLLPQGGTHLRRYVDGMQDESYREMSDGEAAANIVGAIFGYEPPRALRHRDRRAR